MKRLIIFLLLFAAIKVAGQTTGYLRFDTVKIMKQNGTCELYIINKTKDSLGLLTNVGGGLTQFRRSRVLNDSTLVVGLDTLTIRGTGGSGGSSDTTRTEKPVYVKTGANDTLALLYGQGLSIDGDSSLIVKFTTGTVPPARGSQINFFGNSITQYQNAAPIDSAYPVLIADTLGAYWQNYALSGMGVFYMCQKHDSLVWGPFNNAMTMVMGGYNDLRGTSVGNIWRTEKKIASGIKAMILNHFANEYISASTTGTDSTVTRSGTWTTGQDAMQWSGKTKNAASTSTLNDSIVWVSPAASMVGVNLIAGDGTNFVHSTVELFIDNVSQGTFNTNDIADNDALVGAANQRISYAIIVGGLSNTTHRVKLVNNTANIMYVDYFATIDTKKPSFVIFHNINPDGGALQQGGNDAIDSMVLTLPADLPVITVPTNTVFNPATGLDVDGVHPNNTGHKQIYHAWRTAWDTEMTADPGSLIFDGTTLRVSGGGTVRKLLTEADAWNKADPAINAAGFINVPYNMSYKQDGTDILKADKIRFNLAVGPFALIANTTGTANNASGYQALLSNTTGFNNIAFGYRSMELNTTGFNNTAVGYFTMRNNNGTNNTALGMQAMFSNTSGVDNTAVGYLAMNAGTTAANNTGVGSNTLISATSGSFNTMVGYRAGAAITTAGSNTAVGANALRDGTGAGNVAIGTQAGFLNTTGSLNTVVGTASFNGVVGNAFNNNTALGYQTGLVATTASNNIFLGYRAGDAATTGSNNMLFCYDCDLPTATTSNYTSIGNLLMATGPYATGSTVSTEAKLGIKKQAPVWGLDINTMVGINKDSATTVTNITDEFILLVDSGNNLVKKILPSDLGFSDTHIGNTDLTLTGNRTLTMSGNTLNFTGGNVGIGSSGPDRLLDILSTAAAQLRLTHTDNSVYTDFRTDANGIQNIIPTGVAIQAPFGAVSNIGKIPNTVWSETAVTATSGTGETDLHTHTTPTNTLASNGESIVYVFHGLANPTSTADGATMTLRAYWAGTELLEVTSSSAVAYAYKVTITVTRVNSTDASVYAVVEHGGFGSSATNPTYNTITTTFSNTNIIKITGQTTDADQVINVRDSRGIWYPQMLPAL